MAKRYRNNVYYQVGGDTDPASYGGVFASLCGSVVDVWKVESTHDGCGRDALKLGYPFWSSRATYDDADLTAFLNDQFCRSCMDLDRDGVFNPADTRWTRARRLIVAGEAAQAGYLVDDSGGGWSDDVLPTQTLIGYNGRRIRHYFREEDADFRRYLRNGY